MFTAIRPPLGDTVRWSRAASVSPFGAPLEPRTVTESCMRVERTARLGPPHMPFSVRRKCPCALDCVTARLELMSFFGLADVMTATSLMPTCEMCGHNAEGGRCSVCGHSSRAPRHPRTSGAAPSEAAGPLATTAGPGAGTARVERPPVLVAIASPVVRSNEVVGMVVHTDGPIPTPVPFDPWKVGSAVLLAVGLLPIVLLFWTLVISLKIALRIMGYGRNSSGGRSFLDEIVYFNIIRRMTERGEPVPVYHHILETTEARVGVKQMGEFVDGRIFLNHRVRLRVRRRGGVFYIQGGFDETIHQPLSLPRQLWSFAFITLLLLVVVEYSVMAQLGR